MAEQMHQALAILRRKQVEARTGLSRSTIYAKMGDPSSGFPSAIRLGARSVGWVAAEIEAWLKSRIAASRDGSGRAA